MLKHSINYFINRLISYAISSIVFVMIQILILFEGTLKDYHFLNFISIKFLYLDIVFHFLGAVSYVLFVVE